MADARRKDAIAGDIVHEYDGIEEADNELPTWWLIIFYGTIVFGAVYWLAYEQFKVEPTAREALAAVQAERRAKSGNLGDEEVLKAAATPATVAAGKQVFAANCVACHGDKGEGRIGPNLTDKAWIHGGAPKSIFSTIRDGVAAKGMPAWGPVLGQDTVASVAAYVVTLRGGNLPGKEPQGEPYDGP